MRTAAAAQAIEAARQLGLLSAGADPTAVQLEGGVSSDIWRVDLDGRSIALKRALSKLKVAADWRAPVERNAYEVAWFEVAATLAPGSVPRILGHDASAGCFAMEYLDPATYRLWKTELAEGRVDPAFAGLVGDRLGRIHAGTADRADIAEQFATDAIFRPIRLEPYLEATALVHPDRADALAELVAVTAETKRTLVHGDVSPKNILVGPDGPVFLDAECAWFGDPAFDLAFCLNHLLLKCLWVPTSAGALLESFEALRAAYAAHVTWEPPAEVERRAAHLLPGLLLARVDGKSPVEYLTEETDRDTVRRVARHLLAHPVDRLAEVRSAWATELGVT